MTKYFFRIMFGIIQICFLVLISRVDADTNANATPQVTVDGSKLSGSWRKPEALIAKSDAIFTGQLLSLGLPDFGAAGSPSYGAKVKVLQVLKGTVSPEINVILRVTNHGPITEKKPELNHTYLFFATTIKEDNLIQVIKIMEGTDNHVTMVKQLIAQSPK